MSSFLGILGRPFGSNGFVPRRVCGLWPDRLVWEQVAGDALVCLPKTFLFASDRLDEVSA
jgi:hypothetical protein